MLESKTGESNFKGKGGSEIVELVNITQE